MRILYFRFLVHCSGIVIKFLIMKKLDRQSVCYISLNHIRFLTNPHTSYAPLNIYKVVVHLTEGCKPDVKACAALSRLKVFVWQATADCRGWWTNGTNHAKLMDWKLYLSKWQLIFVQNVNVFENCWSRGEPFKSQVVTMTRNLHQKVIEGHAQSGLLHLDFNLKASFMHTRHFSIFL